VSGRGLWISREDLAYALGLAAGLVFTGAVILGAEPPILDRIATSDFGYVWAGPRAILDGDDPYDPVRWAQRTTDLITPVYSYPPPVALALLPLALLPLPIAWFIWTIGGVLLAVVAVRALTRSVAPGQPAVAVVAGFLVAGTRGSWATLLLGQGTFLLIAALAGAILGLRSGRDRMAGLSALALAAKPHLFVIALLAFGWAALRRGQRGAVGWFVAAGGALSAVSLLVFPRGWVTWLQTVPSARASETGSTTIVNAAHDLGAPGLSVALVSIGIFVLIARSFDSRGDAYFAVWTVLSVSVAFYERSYDHLFLVVAVVIAAGVAARSSAARARRTLLASVLVLVAATIALVAVADLRGGYVTFFAVIPPAMFFIVVGACWPMRRSVPAAEHSRGDRSRSSPR
jgi:hypothetical protein